MFKKIKAVFSDMKIVFGSLLLVMGSVHGGQVQAFYEKQPAVKQFASEMSKQHGFKEEELLSLFAEAEKQQKILDAIAKPAERTMTWKRYRKIFIQDSRIKGGQQFIQDYAAALKRAEQTYGVPPHVVTAILGVETRYGKHAGKYRVLDALMTLAFDYPKRSKFFRSELKHFLLLAREQKFEPLDLKGSYAGAMGYGQFIPSSYRRFAVDFDGDGVADILDNPVDAIGSIANYLAEHGWKRGGPVAVSAEVKAKNKSALLPEGQKLSQTVKQLLEAKVQPAEILPEESPARLMELEGASGKEYWIGLQNFYSITRYNHSDLYAMAVFQLSEEILR